MMVKDRPNLVIKGLVKMLVSRSFTGFFQKKYTEEVKERMSTTWCVTTVYDNGFISVINSKRRLRLSFNRLTTT